MAALENARSKIEELGNRLGTSLTVSIGVAACNPERNTPPEDLIRWADGRLYAAKQRGRNHVLASTASEYPAPLGLASELAP